MITWATATGCDYSSAILKDHAVDDLKFIRGTDVYTVE